MDPVLESERLILREANLDDAGFMLRLLSQESWKKYIADHDIKDEDGAKNHLSSRIIPGYKNGRGLWLVALKDSGEPIGICGLVEREFLEHSDLGFAFLDDYQGQGYAAESSRAVMKYAKEELRLSILLAITVPINKHSIKLLERLGFAFKETMSNPEKEQLSVYKVKLSEDKAPKLNLL